MWLCDLLGHMLSYLEPFTHMGMGLLGFQRGGLCMRKSTIYVLVKCLCVESIVVLVSGKWSGVVLVAQCSRHLCLSNLFCKVWTQLMETMLYVYWNWVYQLVSRICYLVAICMSCGLCGLWVLPPHCQMQKGGVILGALRWVQDSVIWIVSALCPAVAESLNIISG